MTAVAQLQAILQFFTRINDLKLLPRTGWLLAGVSEPESLADHTCGVSLYVLFLAEAINADLDSQGLAEPLDVERAVALALIHDLAESVLTDLPTRSTAVLGKHAKHQAEAQIIQSLLADLPSGQRYQQLWQEYDAVSTPEARLVKDVDRLEMVVQALRYAERGHRNLREFWEGHHWHYPICAELYARLLQRAEQT